MNTDHLLDDIREVNLAYLLLMQRLINTDREAAMFRLKIDGEMADLLSRIPVPELARLARCNQLLCHFSLQDADQLYSLIDAGSDEDMRQVHAAILLGSNERRATNERRKTDRRVGERRKGDRRVRDIGPPEGMAERRKGERRKGERRQGERRNQTRRDTDRADTGNDNENQD